MTITVDKIESLKGVLRELPEAPRRMRKLTKRAMVEELRQELERAQKQGYTLNELAQIFEKQGMKIHPTMLGQYLRDKHNATSRNVRKAKGTTVNKATPESAAKEERKEVSKKEVAEGPKTPSVETTDATQKNAAQKSTDQEATRGRPEVTAETSGKTGTQATAQDSASGAVVSSGTFIPRKDTDDI